MKAVFLTAGGRCVSVPALFMADTPRISVVIPCHNERNNLCPLLDAVRGVLEPLQKPFEIIVTDDASTDGSWEVLWTIAQRDRRVRAQRLAAPSGQSAALWAGMCAARGEIIITMDADLQNLPEDIPRLLEALRAADCVCGSRVAARAAGDGWGKRAASRFANWVRNELTHETISDAGCCFRAFRRECISKVKFFNGAHRFLPTLIKMEGFRVVEIPVGHGPRKSGTSHYGICNRLFKSFGDLLGVRWMQRRQIRCEVIEKINE